MIRNLEEIKAKLDILRICERFLIVRKSGGAYKALCPFHEERTPSFVVSPAKGLFHCFGCGEGGDAIAFIQKHKRIEFADAVREAADLCGIRVVEDEKKTYSQKEQKYKTFEVVNFFLKEQLQGDEEALNFIKERGLSEGDIERYDLGLWKNLDSLTAGLKKLNLFGYAKHLGIAFENERGVYYPLAGRLNFLIKNTKGRGIANAGRLIHGAPGDAKYINSRESEIYSKGAVLYNFDIARDEIINKKEALIVEGYIDVIAAAKRGILHAVAPCGTSLTEGHLSQLLRIDERLKIILCFDKDEAGNKATMRALRLLFQNGHFGAKVRFLKGRGVKDFGDLIKGEGKLDEGVDFVDFDAWEYFLKKNFKDADEDSGAKYKLFNEVKMIISSQENFYLRRELAVVAREVLGSARQDLGELGAKPSEAAPLRELLEKRVLRTMMEDEGAAVVGGDYFRPHHFEILGDLFEEWQVDKNSPRLAPVILDENIEPLNDVDFKLALKHLLIEGAKKERKRAIEAEDWAFALELGELIKLIGER